MKYVIGIDQSTQGTKVLLFDEQGKIIGRTDRPHRQIILSNNYVEHDPEEIWNNTVSCIKEVIEKNGIDKNDVVTIGISNQRETTVAWNKKTGKPVYNAIVWQCARAEELCQKLNVDGFGKKVNEITGLNYSPYYAGPKMSWILNNVSEARALNENGELCFGTIDSWLLFKLTGEFKTDVSNASRTMLMDLEKLCWSREICNRFGISLDSLPVICASDECFGCTDLEGYFENKVTVSAMMGDSHAALFGQGCHKEGMIKATYGTGSSIMMNVGTKPVMCDGIAACVAWKRNGQIYYVLEGNVTFSCAVITWLKDDLKLIYDAKESGKLAKLANPDDVTVLVPAFSGLGAPHWDTSAKASICFMSRTTGKNEVVRAAEDSIAHQITDVVETMVNNAGVSVTELRVDGGATRDKYLMQFQSDMLNCKLLVPDVEELSCIGAAYMAGLSKGIYEETVFENINRSSYEPQMNEETRTAKRNLWKKAVESVRRNKI
ncbi:MAG: glycerol kinase GlpK [Erysipelotrichaceae bacterium]|nr:glycerol kinase GlpK [Erysipelotrichaceae bacterium]